MGVCMFRGVGGRYSLQIMCVKDIPIWKAGGTPAATNEQGTILPTYLA